MTNKMRNEIVAAVNNMTVAEMRKAAPALGIKNARQYKREQLSEMIIDAMAAQKEQELEAQAKAKAEKKSNKKSASKKSTVKSAEKSNDKRYKADKVEEDDVDALVHEILSATPAQVDAMDLYSVNRKVLIEVMKQLHCELWYRTYDKPTMIAKITVALGSAAEEE